MPFPRLACCRLLLVSPLLVSPLLLAACSVQDSKTAETAQTQLVGMSEVNLEQCLGAPDQHATFGDIDVLTYDTASTSSTSYSLPVVGGVGFSNGGNCHATFDIRNGHVVRVLYSGEKNALAAPDAYCAPILRTCMQNLPQMKAGDAAAQASADAAKPPP
jgi:hypothetical protein